MHPAVSVTAISIGAMVSDALTTHLLAPAAFVQLPTSTTLSRLRRSCSSSRRRRNGHRPYSDRFVQIPLLEIDLCSTSHERSDSYAGSLDNDQRTFWDTAEKVLRRELGDSKNLSRIWEFIAHNREAREPPSSSSSYQATGLYFPGLAARPWWNREDFPWLQDLELAAADITREMRALETTQSGRGFSSGTGEMSTIYDATQGWGTLRIRYLGRYGQDGVDYTLLARTLSTVSRLPLAPETVAFQRQLPGTGLPLHVDPSNFVLGCHLGLVIPSALDTTKEKQKNDASARDRFVGKYSKRVASATTVTGEHTGGRGFGPTLDRWSRSTATRAVRNASIRTRREQGPNSKTPPENRVGGELRAWMEVAGEKRSWETGQAFVFDPSFVHRTQNPTAGERIILNLDIWHPDLRHVERRAIVRVCQLVEDWNSRSGPFGR